MASSASYASLDSSSSSSSEATHDVSSETKSINRGIKVPHVHEKNTNCCHKSKQMITRIRGSIELSWTYFKKDTLSNPRSFLIGIITIILVVMFTAALKNVLGKTSDIFLTVAERDVGECDVVYRPSNTGMTLLNFTDINSYISKTPNLAASAPRWLFLGRARGSGQSVFENVATRVTMADTAREKLLNVSRGWSHPPLGPWQTHVTSSLLEILGVKPGETLYIDIPIGSLADEFVGSQMKESLRNAIALASQRQLPQGASQIPPYITSCVMALLPWDRSDFVQNLLVNTTTIITNVVQCFGKTNPAIEAAYRLYGDLVTAQLKSLLSRSIPNITIKDGSLSAAFTVVDAVDLPRGKWSDRLGNMVLLDSQQLTKSIAASILTLFDAVITVSRSAVLFKNLPIPIADIQNGIQRIVDITNLWRPAILQFHSEHYAMMVNVWRRNRQDMYNGDTKYILKQLAIFTNDLASNLGISYPIKAELPLVAQLKVYQWFQVMGDQAANMIILILVSLGCALIYSLLLANVGEKTYEFGMMRALGMPSSTLMELLMMRAFLMAIPGTLIGISFAVLVNIPIEYIICDYTNFNPDFSLTTNALIVAILIGLIMPIVSMIVPIRRALSKTLRDSLDLYHQVTSETMVKSVDLRTLGLSPIQSIIAVFLVVFSTTIYYVIPYSVISQQFFMFVAVLFAILIAMLAGLSLALIPLQPYLENLILYLFLWGRDRRLGSIIRKNMAGHRIRSRKTAIMFTIAMALIVFATVGFGSQLSLLSSTAKALMASDLSLWTPNADFSLDYVNLSRWCERELSRGDASKLMAYSWSTFPLFTQKGIRGSSFTNLANFPSNLPAWLFGVSEGYMNSIYSEYAMFTETDDSLTYSLTDKGTKDVVKSLYVDRGHGKVRIDKLSQISFPDVVLSGYKFNERGNVLPRKVAYSIYAETLMQESSRYRGSIDTSTAFITKSSYAYGSRSILSKARAMVKKLPGFLFSGHELASYAPQQVVVSIPQYLELMQSPFDVTSLNVTDLGYQRLFLRLRNPDSKNDRMYVKNAIKTYMRSDLLIIFDTIETINNINDVFALVMIFENIVVIVALILCFFLSWVSFHYNVTENGWEFGVLRSLGLDEKSLTRCYIYEALCLVISSSILGIFIGLLVSISLVLLYCTMLEMPFTLPFPFFTLLLSMVLSVGIAIAASYFPAKYLRSKSISNVLKGLVG